MPGDKVEIKEEKDGSAYVYINDKNTKKIISRVFMNILHAQLKTLVKSC